MKIDKNVPMPAVGATELAAKMVKGDSIGSLSRGQAEVLRLTISKLGGKAVTRTETAGVRVWLAEDYPKEEKPKEEKPKKAMYYRCTRSDDVCTTKMYLSGVAYCGHAVKRCPFIGKTLFDPREIGNG